MPIYSLLFYSNFSYLRHVINHSLGVGFHLFLIDGDVLVLDGNVQVTMILGIGATSQLSRDFVTLIAAIIFGEVKDGLFPVGRFIKWTGSEGNNSVPAEFNVEKG